VKNEITYSDHLKFRLKIREINNNIPKLIFENSKEHYYDSLTGYNVCVSEINYKGKQREMVVVYEETTSKIKLITIHPLQLHEKLNKLNSGRWQKR
jgi:hypothetical protein